MASAWGRKRPNILITGTPGTGKTTTAATVANFLGFRHICVGELVVKNKLFTEYDAEFDTHVPDEDKVNAMRWLVESEYFFCLLQLHRRPLLLLKASSPCTDADYDWFDEQICDELEPMMRDEGAIVDFHSSDFFPERWFDLVVVLRTDNQILYPRLEKR